MLVPLKIGVSTPDEPRGAVDMLLDCHARIRRFSSLAVVFASAPDSHREELPSVAQQLVRYFGIALPLHVADEDLSLAPLLADLPSLEPVLKALHQQHEELEADLVPLLTAWRTPNVEVAARAELRARSEALARTFEEHLQLEERELLPTVRKHLDASIDERLVREFRARRGAPPRSE